uniref:Uncharacterized protein n=1 Tax=Macrostomum lignano TaxID=282301 RepID=A0A1I8HJV5_9PLAT
MPNLQHSIVFGTSLSFLCRQSLTKQKEISSASRLRNMPQARVT